MPARFRFARSGRALLLVLSITLLAAAGCNQSNRLPVHPVEGQLSWRGQPLSNAYIVLHPHNPSSAKVLPARGQTDATGKFQITTYEQADGAAAGDYRVTVEHYRPIRTASGIEPGPNVLPPKFARPDTTDIIVRVAEGKNTLQPIALR